MGPRTTRIRAALWHLTLFSSRSPQAKKILHGDTTATQRQGLRLNVTTPISEKRQVFTHQKRCYNTGVHTPRRGVTTVFTRCSHTSYCEYDTCQSPLCLLGSAHGVLRQVYSAARMVCFLRYKPWRSAGRSTCRQRHRLVSRKLILQN